MFGANPPIMSEPQRERPRLYLITPPQIEDVSVFVDQFRAAVQGGDIASLQIRVKDGDAIDTVKTREVTKAVKRICAAEHIALIINVGLIFGLLSIIGATLTLPGIAGFVLTIGAAVDANVLINERIREERKRGRRVVAAVENGYKEASRAIYDANITNFIAGVLLFMFGTGPVRGFAVVLVIGLFTSVFTAVVLTRMWVAGWLRNARPNDLSL